MRWHLLLVVFLVTTPFVSAWNTTFYFQPPSGQVLRDIVLNYTSNCTTWTFGTFDDGRLVREFAFFVNGSGSIDLQDYLYIDTPSNSTLHLESSCELNVTAYPRYGIYMHPPEIRAFSTEFRLVKMPFKKVGKNQFSVNTPWNIVAIYLESNTIYDNGTYVSRLPLRASVLWDDHRVSKNATGGETLYWVDVSDEMPSGNVTLKLAGERAGYITHAYGYALVPHKEDRQWWLIYNYDDGYLFGDGRPWRNILIRLEFLWKGEDFTLASFTTEDGKELNLRVENGRICLGKFPTKKCGPHQLPKGALKLTIGFQNGYLWALGEGSEYFNAYTGDKAAALTRFLWGIPQENRYSVEIHAKESTFWKPKRGIKIGPMEVLSGSALVISLLAIYMARRR